MADVPWWRSTWLVGRATCCHGTADRGALGGLAVASEAGCPVIGGHSIDDPEPKYGMAVTGIADPARLLRNDAAMPGLPLTLTKPLGTGLLNNRHKQTGQVFDEAVATMTQLNRAAAEQAVAAGVRSATDVTGFGLLGHLYKMTRASGVGAVIDRAAVPVLEAARDALRDGFVSGGTRRNLDWVRPHLRAGVDVSEDDLLLLTDAQTSGGLLVVGSCPGIRSSVTWSRGLVSKSGDHCPVVIESSVIPAARRAASRRSAARSCSADREPTPTPPRTRRTASRPTPPSTRVPTSPRRRGAPSEQRAQSACDGQPFAPLQHSSRAAVVQRLGGHRIHPALHDLHRHQVPDHSEHGEAPGRARSPRPGVVIIARPDAARLAELDEHERQVLVRGVPGGRRSVGEQHRGVDAERRREQRCAETRGALNRTQHLPQRPQREALTGDPIDLGHGGNPRPRAERAENPGAEAHRRRQLDRAEHVDEPFGPAKVGDQSRGAEHDRHQRAESGVAAQGRATGQLTACGQQAGSAATPPRKR